MTIALDAATASGGQPTAASPVLWNHVVGSGSDTHLYVSVASYSGTTGYESATAVTYGGVTMTKVRARQFTDGAAFYENSVWSLVDPTVGTGQVSVTHSGGDAANRVGAGSVSYFGVAHVDTDDGTFGGNDTTVSGTHITTTVTPSSDNCWILFCGFCHIGQLANPTWTLDASLVSRASPVQARNRALIADWNGGVSPAAGTTVGCTPSGGTFGAASFLAIAIAPFATAASDTPFPFMGGGYFDA